MALQHRKINCEVLVCLLLMCCCCFQLPLSASHIDNENDIASLAEGIGKKESVKKDLERIKIAQLPVEMTEVPILPVEVHLNTNQETQQLEKVVTINEKSLADIQIEADRKRDNQPNKGQEKAKSGNKREPTEASTPKQSIRVQTSQVQVEESGFKQKMYNVDDEIPESYKLGFYFLFGLSSLAIILIVAKIYRMRLSRAERKYGVQGDRSTQELTPLPIAIEDGNSDEEDHTLFEVNRQQIRIL